MMMGLFLYWISIQIFSNMLAVGGGVGIILLYFREELIKNPTPPPRFLGRVSNIRGWKPGMASRSG
jgi:hypothetical protein